jgi:hypothetical protein
VSKAQLEDFEIVFMTCSLLLVEELRAILRMGMEIRDIYLQR